MPTQYFPLTDKQAANIQNKDWWEKILGRPKRPEDVTEYLFGTLVNPIDGKVLLVVDQPNYDKLFPLLTPQQQTFVTNNILQENDPLVIATKAAIDAAHPGTP